VSLDLAFDDTQQSVAEAIAQFCRDRCDDAAVRGTEGKFPEALWRELAELGVLALGTPEGDGGCVEMVAALESLGAAVFPGPLGATFFATQVLPDAKRSQVARGEAVVSVGVPPLMPWAPVAHVFVAITGGRVFLGRPQPGMESLDTLGGEPWGRVEIEFDEDLGDGARAHAVYDMALAAYLAAAGERLVADTTEHARTRKQFGKSLGEFQAVAHPLADCAIQLAGASTLARAAAFRIEAAAGNARATAAAARLSAVRAAVATARICHQLFGAVGITLEGPVFHVSRRIRQLASQPPLDDTARAVLLDHFDVPGVASS
jgi:alkylation response protein AidB-like acyl-CoA dehydrogenase